MHLPASTENAVETAGDDLFFIDVHGEDPTPAEVVDYAPPNLETSSTIDSSEDEVIFNGRSGVRNARTNVENSRVRAKDAPASVQVRTLEENTLITNREFTRETIDPAPITLRNATRAQKKKHSRQRFQQAFFPHNDDEILADYVANMDSQYALPDDSSIDNLSDDQSELSDEDPAKMRRAVAFGQKNTRKPKHAFPENELPDLINSGPSGKEAMESQDDSTDDEQSDESEVSVSLSDLISYSQRRPHKDSRAKTMTRKLPRTNAYDDFLDYEKFADFDIMDLERDSLHKNKKKKKKGRKLDFDLSDSDLEMQLQEGWERDRNKKKAKKQEREQLRAQGLLGKRSKPTADGTGITMEEVKTQVKGFLLSSADTLDLPPMDKKQRRIVHELANAVSLKSQSRGKGATRYPVLYKTARTPNFNGKHSVKLDKILSQPRFVKIGNMRPPRNFDKEPKKGKNIQRSKGDFGYIEGDVVGGAAPEIAANNKGRAMLEKMGWSSGTALGALNNKGILQPVTQVMKNSRAGLG